MLVKIALRHSYRVFVDNVFRRCTYEWAETGAEATDENEGYIKG